MKRRFSLLIILIVLAAIAVLIALRIFAGRKPVETKADAYNRVRVTRGDMRISIDASGKVAPSNEVELFPAEQGRVMAVLVEAGQLVKAGQVLIRLGPLDSEDAATALRQAEDALAVAQAQLRTARENAALSPVQARGQLEKAKASVAIAKAKLDQVKAGPTAEEVTQAKSAANQAQLTFQSAQADFERYKKLYAEQAVTKQQYEQAENKVLAARESLAAAEAKLAQTLAPPKAEDLAAAEAAYTQARIELSVAEENLRHLDQDDQVASAEAAERKARDSLATARKNLAGSSIVAPIDGMVTAVNTKRGVIVTTENAVVSLADPRVLVVEADVDEADITQIRPGQAAVVTMDALLDKEFRGRVTSAGALGEEKNGVVVFTIKVAVDDPSAEDLMKPGMNADVEIVVAEKRGVLSVPNSTLENRMGRTVVRVYGKDGQVAYRRVTTGMRTDAMTEIVDGLREGDVLAVHMMTNSSPLDREQRRNNGMPRGGGPMGGGNMMIFRGR